VEAIGAEGSDENGAKQAKDEACVVKGVGHGQDAGAQAALQQMYQRLFVPVKRAANQSDSTPIQLNAYS
jgi:hypothetical protein